MGKAVEAAQVWLALERPVGGWGARSDMFQGRVLSTVSDVTTQTASLAWEGVVQFCLQLVRRNPVSGSGTE